MMKQEFEEKKEESLNELNKKEKEMLVVENIA